MNTLKIDSKSYVLNKKKYPPQFQTITKQNKPFKPTEIEH